MLPPIGILVMDLAASWFRMFAALILAVVFSIAVGVAAATNQKAEQILLPAIDVLQTIPILGFFPVVIYLIVIVFPNFIGINLAVIFLIFTSMAWNITFGVYESVKSIPSDFITLARLSHFSRSRFLRELYIPAAMPRMAQQINVSWAVGLFYLVSSEIFSTGSSNFSVKYGIGAEVANLVATGNFVSYAIVLVFLVAAVLLTRFVFLTPLSMYSERFSFKGGSANSDSKVVNLYKKIWGVFQKFAASFQAKASYRKMKTVEVAMPMPKFIRREKKVGASPALLALIVFLISIAVFFANSYFYLPALFTALAYSFIRVWFMYLFSILIALPFGILIAKSKRFYEPSLSVIQVVASVPAPMLMPLVVALLLSLPFGNELMALAVIFLSMIWYILFSVIAGMRTIPEEFVELSRQMKFNWIRGWKNLYIPAVLPSFVTGSITAIGGAWNALIVAEYFTVENAGGRQVVLSQVGIGIGKLLDQATYSGNLNLILLSLLSMVLMVTFVNRFVWQRAYKFVTSRYKIEVDM